MRANYRERQQIRAIKICDLKNGYIKVCMRNKFRIGIYETICETSYVMLFYKAYRKIQKECYDKREEVIFHVYKGSSF